MFILCLIMLFFVGTHMLHFYKVFHTNGYHFFKCLWLSRNLSYPEHQFLCATSFPKEDTQMRDLWSSVQIHWFIRRHQRSGKNPPEGTDRFKGSPHGLEGSKTNCPRLCGTQSCHTGLKDSQSLGPQISLEDSPSSLVETSRQWLSGRQNSDAGTE